MQKDTRDKNRYFNRSTLETYLKEYSSATVKALESISFEELDRAYAYLIAVRQLGSRIFVGGNGGSAAISDHLNCDFTKGVHTPETFPLQLISLVGSHALHTAIANDMGYEKTLSHQLMLNSLRSTDVVILISSSGNSPNIIEAATYALYRKARVIGLTGFDGGKLKKMANAKLHIDAHNYGVVEDCHQSLMHILAQYLYLNA